MIYRYHCVGVPTDIFVHSNKELDKAIRTYEDIINKQAAEGWEYVGIDAVTATQHPGCFSFGTGPQETNLKMLVFRRPA